MVAPRTPAHAVETGMLPGLLVEYRASLKAPEVEETIDLWLHRPLGFILAKLVRHTWLTPNQITLLSIAFAASAATAWVVPFSGHRVLGAILLVLSAALDCADGMLARMRGTASELGRMLDGASDLASVAVVTAAVVVRLLALYGTDTLRIALVLAVSALTVFVSSRHTLAYDHYKNLFVRLTSSRREGEDVEAARARRAEAERRGMTFVERLVFAIYVPYLERQSAFIRRFDPAACVHLDALPPFDAARAAAYRSSAGRAMGLWRTLYGFGSLVLTLTLCIALDRPELVLVVRLVVLEALLVLYLGPLQRRASRAAFEAMGRQGLSAEADVR